MAQADGHTMVGAYALDALDDAEREAFERHLADCDECRDEVAGLRATVLRLADAAAVPPPPRVREQVLAQVRVTPQARDVVALPRRRDAAARPRSRGWLVAAAVLALVSLGTGGLAWSQYQAAETARAEAARVNDIVTDPGAKLVQQRLPAGGTATLVVAGSRAVVAGADLPALPDGRTYQLWIVRPGGITSAGLGPAGDQATGRWSRAVDGVRRGDVVAVSVEPDGGSSQPTTTPLVTLQA
jgi:anti-sigma-K factor RskA